MARAQDEGVKWIVGLDLRPAGRGALTFVRWLSERSSPPLSPDAFRGIHVLEQSVLLRELRHEHLCDLEAKILATAKDEYLQTDTSDVLGAPEVLQGDTADAVLSDVATDENVLGVVIGRQAGAKDTRIVRLGRVARHLVRSLPAPTVVVPADLQVDSQGEGPILLACDLRDSTSGATVFARYVADQLGRPLKVVHVIPYFDAASFVPSETVQQVSQKVGVAQAQELESWMKARGQGEATHEIAVGDPAARLLEIAHADDAPLIVCGSRRLALHERIFTTSVGSTLAAFSSVPVAVVPADFVLSSSSDT